MKLLSRHSRIQVAAGLFLASGVLFLMTNSKPACADGFYFPYDQSNYDDFSNADAGSMSHFNPGQSPSASSYSYYAAQSSDITTAIGGGNDELDYIWVDGDQHSPRPTHSYDAAWSSDADGDASASGAKAHSEATGGAAGTAPAAYLSGSGYSVPLGNPGLATYVEAYVFSSTSAEPDNTADPNEEQYGNPTAAAAGAACSLDLVIHGSIMYN